MVDDAQARRRLLESRDPDRFVAAVIEEAARIGIDVSADEVRHGLADARRTRLERWL